MGPKSLICLFKWFQFPSPEVMLLKTGGIDAYDFNRLRNKLQKKQLSLSQEEHHHDMINNFNQHQF
jgi:hypothetical protein